MDIEKFYQATGGRRNIPDDWMPAMAGFAANLLRSPYWRTRRVDYGLKTIATAVGEMSPEHAVVWPTGLGAGLSAMVAGWRAYEQAEPMSTEGMTMLGGYLETDCKALWQVLRWLRSMAPRRCTSGGWYNCSGIEYARVRTAEGKPCSCLPGDAATMTTAPPP